MKSVTLVVAIVRPSPASRMASSRRVALVAVAALLLAAPSRADTLKVPAEFDSIQQAVDAAATGDVVLVSKGTYGENVLVSTPGIALRGKSGATISGGSVGNCIRVQADDVEVSGLTLVNGGSALLAAGAGDGDPFGGLHVTGTGALISKLTVAACEDFGILLEGTGIVEKCEVDGCASDGISIQTDNFLGSVVTEVCKNRVTRCLRGIELEDGPFLVEKNVCEDILGDGLVVDIPVPFADGLQVLATTISKNECRRNAGTGLDIFKGTGPAMLVDKNVVEANSFGLFANGFDIDITGNTIEDNRLGGAWLQTTASEFSGNKVRGNVILGVYVQAAQLFAAASDGGDGGSEDGSNLIQDNTIQDNAGDGVRVESDSNTADDNVIKGNLGDGVHITGSGVILNTVTDNTITANGHDGIDNSAGATLISDNVSKDNGGADLAGIGDGSGSADNDSTGNVTGDGTDLTSLQELELDTLVL